MSASSAISGASADSVNLPNKAYAGMAVKWDLIDDLLGGTLAMRAAGVKWLPRESKEDDTSYSARINRSYLYGALKDTVQKLTAKPFSKPVTTKGELIEQMRPMLGNVDFQGSDLTQFARSIFDDALTYGKAHILVDFPQTGGGLSLAAERNSGVRPYFARISPPDLISWRTERMSDGSQRLTQIRFVERRTEIAEAGFGESEVEYIRVIEPFKWQLWKRKDDGGEYSLHDEGEHSFNGVPMVTTYTNRMDFMVSGPPLEDLAWLNLAHWQSLSDQRNILRFARLGILFASGFSDEEVEKGIIIGASKLTASTNPDAKLMYVEHSGQAIGAGEADLAKLEERMEVLGLQPLVQSTGNATATARAMDEARTHSNVQAWVRGLENALMEAFGIAAEWLNAKLPEDFSVDIFSDFGVSLSATDDVKALIVMRQNAFIQHTTLLDEIKRRGILSDDLDAQSEVEAIGGEGLGQGDGLRTDLGGNGNA